MQPSRIVSFARKIRIMGRDGYVLRPSPTNPRVRRWQRANVQDAERMDEKTASTLQSVHVQRSSYKPKRHITEPMLDLPRRLGKMLGFDRIATLARHQTDGLDRHGELEPIKRLIERKVTTGGQLGADHLLVMEELLNERGRHPLMVDTFSADYNDFPRWAEQTREWVHRNGGAIVGAVPRTSAFHWDPAWGPPPSRSGLGVGKEGTLLIAPPRNRAAEFARLYAQAAKKEYAADKLKAELDELLRTGRDPRRTEYLLGLTEGLVYDDPQFDWRGELNKRYHADRYRREPGRWLAEEAWHDPDVRTNFGVPDFVTRRFVKTPAGVHYFSEELDGGPEIFVGPEIATYSEGSRIAEDDLYRGRAFAAQEQTGYTGGMKQWAEPQRGILPQYFPIKDRIEFVMDGTRWKLVGYDKVPLWRPDYGWGYHALYKGEDGGWAEWRFQYQNGKVYHENEPFRRIPEDTLPDWAKERQV